MPLGNPEGPTQSQWTVAVGSVVHIGDYPVTFNITATTDNPDAPEVPAIVQTFVDMIAGSKDFQVYSAARTYSFSEQITPTA